MDNIKTLFEDIFEVLKLLLETMFKAKEAENTYNEIVENVKKQIINEYNKEIIIFLIILVIIIVFLMIRNKRKKY